MLDVLEHIEEDWETMMELHELLNEEGRVFVTVSDPWLSSKGHHHTPRYSMKTLRQLFEQTQWSMEFVSPYNTFLYPASALYQLMKRVREIGRIKIRSHFLSQIKFY